MAVYVVCLIDIDITEGMQQYQKNYPALVESFGGTYLARGGNVEALEGGWDHDRLVVWNSPTEGPPLRGIVLSNIAPSLRRDSVAIGQRCSWSMSLAATHYFPPAVMNDKIPDRATMR